MALDKAIKSGKEHRKPYRGSKAIDGTCRNHGSCPWCKQNRQHKFRDKQADELSGGMKMKLRMRVVIYTEMEDDETIDDAVGRVLNAIYGAGMNVYAYDGVELVD